jgi:hypothetical protein
MLPVHAHALHGSLLPVQGALALSEAQTAAAELQSDAHGVMELAPPPPQLPGLMRHNPGLAAQLLLRLADAPEVGCWLLLRHTSCMSHRCSHNAKSH